MRKELLLFFHDFPLFEIQSVIPQVAPSYNNAIREGNRMFEFLAFASMKALDPSGQSQRDTTLIQLIQLIPDCISFSGLRHEGDAPLPLRWGRGASEEQISSSRVDRPHILARPIDPELLEMCSNCRRSIERSPEYHASLRSFELSTT